MSNSKTILSNLTGLPLDFDLIPSDQRQDVEKKLDFITSQRLKTVLDHIGQDRFVHVSGRSWKQVSRYLKGDNTPTEVLNSVAIETGTSIDWLAKGTLRTAADARFQERLLNAEISPRRTRLNMARSDEERSKLGYALKLLKDKLEELKRFTPSENDEPSKALPMGDVVTNPKHDQNRFVFLPRYDVEASAGSGSITDTEHHSGVVGFDRQFLREKGAVPEHCKIIQARGDSMSPTIPDGSLLIVDHSQTEISNGYISVIAIDDDLLVKRIRRRLDGMIDLISDNPAYQAESIAKDRLSQLRVIGRVVYFCRTP